MRIIAGSLGGRSFAAPRGHHTRPMSEKVRGALFNALGDINGLSVLDAFAGSGALSFEAVSRGATTATAIDSDRSAQQAISASLASLGLQNQVRLIKANAAAWLSTAPDQFDLILCDPPYDDLQPRLLKRLAERARPGGTVVLSLPPTAKIELSQSLQPIATKAYGDATLHFYRHTS